MSRAQLHDAIVAFLNQFVKRGASPNLTALAGGLVTDPGLQSQLDTFLSDQMTEREGFNAMRAFLADWSSGESRYDGSADVFDLLSWTEGEPDGGTSDPAQWHDWLGAIAAAEGR
jgi:hypothetical protein